MPHGVHYLKLTLNQDMVRSSENQWAKICCKCHHSQITFSCTKFGHLSLLQYVV